MLRGFLTTTLASCPLDLQVRSPAAQVFMHSLTHTTSTLAPGVASCPLVCVHVAISMCWQSTLAETNQPSCMSRNLLKDTVPPATQGYSSTNLWAKLALHPPATSILSLPRAHTARATANAHKRLFFFILPPERSRIKTTQALHRAWLG